MTKHYILGIAIGILLLLHPVQAEPQQVTSPTPKPTTTLATPVKRWNPSQDVINIQNKKRADKKEAERKAEEARQQAIEQARIAEQQRVAAINAQKEKEAQKASKSVSHSAVIPQSYPQPDNFYKSFIYNKESGNRLNAIAPNGACGLGQSLPCSKLMTACPNWLNDYNCQDMFFTSYVVARYGGWEQAYNFWIAHSWW